MTEADWTAMRRQMRRDLSAYRKLIHGSRRERDRAKRRAPIRARLFTMNAMRSAS